MKKTTKSNSHLMWLQIFPNLYHDSKTHSIFFTIFTHPHRKRIYRHSIYVAHIIQDPLILFYRVEHAYRMPTGKFSVNDKKYAILNKQKAPTILSTNIHLHGVCSKRMGSIGPIHFKNKLSTIPRPTAMHERINKCLHRQIT